MEIADQRPQLVPLVVILLLRAIARIGGKIADSVISPVIDQFLSIKVPAEFCISSNSKIGIISTAVIPSHFRYGIFSRSP